MKLQQLLALVYIRGKRRIRQSPLNFTRALRHRACEIASGLTVRVRGTFDMSPIDIAGSDVSRHLETANRAVRREFRFINKTVKFGHGVDWTLPDSSQLWRYNLQYHDYLVSLAIAWHVTSRPEYYEALRDIALDWISSATVGQGDAWHPYCVSLRIANWIHVLALIVPRLERDPKAFAAIRESLVEQVLFLSRNLEHDVGGNHLLENIKALILAGTYFSGSVADGWVNKGLRLLSRELSRQVLPDGAHYERSPMYHAIVLEGLLVIAGSLQNAGLMWPEKLEESLQRMVAFHSGMLHPDGNIALFNDSAFGVGPDAQELLAFSSIVLGGSPAAGVLLDAKHAIIAGTRLGNGCTRAAGVGSSSRDATIQAYPTAGYYVVRHPGNAFFFDAGPVCPDDLPAHAHADIFSYELSIQGHRCVVDSGVCEYAGGVWRDYARSSRAHNTIVVDGLNQVDVWASFRVGRRVSPQRVFSEWSDGCAVLAGEHHGFRKRRRHIRVAALMDGEAWLIVDEVTGGTASLIQNFIHLHPEIRVTPSHQGATFVHGELTINLYTTGFSTVQWVSGEHEPLNGWYMPEFGAAVSSSTFVGVTSALPSYTAYLLTTGQVQGKVVLHRSGHTRSCDVTCGERMFRLSWDDIELKPSIRRV